MHPSDELIGSSELFLSVLEHTSKLAVVNRPVLILGERGTGKELIAKRLHFLSPRWNKPLISLNCAALSEGLIDSELFGHEAGSFSGAKNRHQGRFERAQSGTLFLDELATAPPNVQEKLLRVLEYGEFERVGGAQVLQSDVRLICATNAYLPDLVKQNQFRADLLDRIAFDVIHLPPLRERQEDILPLADYFAIKMCQTLGYACFVGFSAQALHLLRHYPWPGNVRELKNVVERAVYRHGEQKKPIDHIVLDPFIQPWKKTQEVTFTAHTAPQVQDSNEVQEKIDAQTVSLPCDLRHWQRQQELQLLQQALQQARYNQQQAAKLLGISYHQLRGLLRKHGDNSENEK
ncbi:MAG: phage shock protein operon transcriptional activator [Vibrionaceae bacterium]